MKFNKHQKITIYTLGLMIIGAFISSAPKMIEFIKIKQQNPTYYVLEINLKPSFADSAQEYKLFSDMFEQNEPVLVYGYTQGDLNPQLSESFDKKLHSIFEKENIQHKVIAYKDWKSLINAVNDKYIDNNATCTMTTKKQEQLEEYLNFLNNCLKKSCIINTKTNTYLEMNRDVELIIETIKGNVKIIK